MVYQRKWMRPVLTKYNKGLLFDNRQQEILQQMDEAEGMLNVGIK